ncbi:PQQ-binding-like beta-propeller repeat protein [Promicromonospora iranensis]|uniref:outer membrane protein assembly factor BamB family protein n=1 Tax=Promicromonospora iranensis TaxID=1105144 RepID=UPI0023A91D3A|nr:PQQ-binding-like beta-propeller repeat protein [Promicromonospora iranensis]
MARDPDQRPALVFDLVEQDTVEQGISEPAVPYAAARPDDPRPPAAPDDGEHGEHDGDAPLPYRAHGGWRAVTTVAAILAIAVGTGIASDGVRDGARIERLRDADGGVEDLSGPLEERWAWDGAVGTGESLDGTEAVVLGDVLAFESGPELVALDPATGAQAWTVPLGDDPECGPLGVSPYAGTPAVPASVLVCLSGSDTNREVVTVRPDGATSARRALDPSDTRRYGPPRPGPDGTVLRARRVGPESAVDRGDARCNENSECSGTVLAGRDVELRAEDAVTGDMRWTVVLPFQEADAHNCWRTSWADRSGDVFFDGLIYPNAFTARITADLVDLTGCGVAATITPDGTLLGAELEPGTGAVESRGAGRYAWLDYSGPARTVLYSGDGAVVGELPGYVRGPRASDGTGPATMIGNDETGLRLRAYDTDGTRRWDVGARSPEQPFLAQVGRTAVLTAGVAEVYGLDVATGAERWHWDGSDVGEGVLQAFTDGHSVLLLLIQPETGIPRMVSLDAATGEMLWQEGDDVPADGPDYWASAATLIAVDGHLLEVDGTGVRKLG